MTLHELPLHRVALSEAARERIGDLAARYPQRRTALLPALKLAQQEVGYLPPHTIAEVADLIGVSHAAAQELVAFYSMLLPHAEGATRVVVCAQLPCALRGAHRLIRQLENGFGLKAGETTPGGEITLERTSECFGACHRAPMARVNERYVEHLDEASTARLIAELKQAATPRVSAPNGSLPEYQPNAPERGQPTTQKDETL